MFEPKVFREKMYRVEEGNCDIVGTFRRPPVIRPQGRCATLAPLVTPLQRT